MTTFKDPAAASIEIGRMLVRGHLADAAPEDTPEDRARRGWRLADIAARAGSATSACEITSAVTSILHLADGWHTADAVLTKAFKRHYAPMLPEVWADAAYGGQEPHAVPRVPGPDADPRDMDALAGAIADLFAGAAGQFNATAEDIADAAEIAFWDDAAPAHRAIVRQMRERAERQ
ncbi:hypothetical protein [Streptomyces yaizuensis]|uniref:Uncharacterized protein n=1 Tax=Streptomyces yaizuensis TaxID=2989713 RepID=A0AA86IX32_9ACTN|nr:hypothetical protein [Streptomyces sp. YSPA8]BDT39673.1 hypothetical protein SYYSPA8_37775 [Streptomyces sp. YSPA8]